MAHRDTLLQLEPHPTGWIDRRAHAATDLMTVEDVQLAELRQLLGLDERPAGLLEAHDLMEVELVEGDELLGLIEQHSLPAVLMIAGLVVSDLEPLGELCENFIQGFLLLANVTRPRILLEVGQFVQVDRVAVNVDALAILLHRLFDGRLNDGLIVIWDVQVADDQILDIAFDRNVRLPRANAGRDFEAVGLRA